MHENTNQGNVYGHSDGCDNSALSYLKRAVNACAAGNDVLGMHLYLAAFEKDSQSAHAPSDEALRGLRRAWELACSLKERSLAEYIFEKLEPYLEPAEVAECADQLQKLALDKLEEFGLSREDFEEMTDMISQDFMDQLGSNRVMKVEHFNLNPASKQPKKQNTEDTIQGADTLDTTDKGTDKPENSTFKSEGADQNEEVLASPEAGEALDNEGTQITYADLVGYDQAVETMRKFGIGVDKDPEFNEFIEELNARHGLSHMPAMNTIIIRAQAVEDADRFILATVGELGLPAIRMNMEENLQGMPVLCVTAQANNQPPLNPARTAFEGPAVLVLEDIDSWMGPSPDSEETQASPLLSNLTRGARETINLIQSAVTNPDVYVLASVSSIESVDAMFYDMLGGVSIVDIADPTASERAAIWTEIVKSHPSMRKLDRKDLVRFTAKMPRVDIYLAAQEAIEDAYKQSLMSRTYVAVTRENILEKIASFQPWDSHEYRALENALIDEFKGEIDDIEASLSDETEEGNHGHNTQK